MAKQYFNNPNVTEKSPSGCLVVLLILWLLLAGSTLFVLVTQKGWAIFALNAGLLALVTLAIKFIRR